MRTMCADDVRMSPGVVLHEIRQLRQVFAWVLAIKKPSCSSASSPLAYLLGNEVKTVATRFNVIDSNFPPVPQGPDNQACN